MSKQKYYYAVVNDEGNLVRIEVPDDVPDDDATFDIIPIPAEELNQLIKKYRKK